MFSFDRHNRLRKNLAAYADGELSSRDAAAVERHLAACEPCSAELDGLRLASAALKELPALDAPRSFALTPDMLGAPTPQPRPRVIPAYQPGMRLAAAGLAVALVVVVFADRADFRGDGGSSNEAQLQELDNRLSETFGATADSAGGNSDTQLNDSADEVDSGDSPAATSAAGLGLGVGGAESPAEATRVPGDSIPPAADQGADASPGSLPAHGAVPDNGDSDTEADTKSNEDLAAAEGDADTLQDGDEREAVGNDDDSSSAFTIVEIVLAVLLAAALGGLGLGWFSQRRKPL